MTEFITRTCKAESRYEVIIKTDSEEHYNATEDFARRLIDHAKTMTNADRIRAMSDEELMQLLFTKISCGHICSFCVPSMRTECKCDGHCRNGVLKWLKQPTEGEGKC